MRSPEPDPSFRQSAGSVRADAAEKSFAFDLADNLTDWTDPNGTAVEMACDDAGRKTSVEVTRATEVLGTTA